MKKKKLIFIIGSIILVLSGVGFYFLSGKGNGNSAETSVGIVKRIIKIERGSLNVVVSANGVIQPIHRVDIKSKASGQIVELNFEEGQTVTKDDLLIRLDQNTAKNDYEQAKADLAVAEANATQAEHNFNRVSELFKKGLVSEQELDQAKVDQVRTKAQIVKAQAALSSADERLRDTRVLSPITGVILSKNVDMGQIISSGVSNVGGGTLLATIADMQRVYVETYVDEVDIGRVLVNQKAKVVADAYPDDTFIGDVIRIAPLGKTQQNVTTFTVIVLVENTGGKLKAGMSASVELEIFNKSNVVLVPNEALYDSKTPQGRELFAEYQKSHPEKEKKKEPEKTVRKKEEQKDERESRMMGGETNWQEMRERFMKMSPEERQKFRDRMRQRFMAQGGPGFGSEGESPRGTNGSQSYMFRMKRKTEDPAKPEVRQRLVVVKENDKFVTRMIKVGATNFEFSEVVDGLKDGEEIEVTTISRALIASEQFNQRIRSQTGLGGMSGSSSSRQVMGGRGGR